MLTFTSNLEIMAKKTFTNSCTPELLCETVIAQDILKPGQFLLSPVSSLRISVNSYLPLIPLSDLK